ncbi:MAG: diguanylate cyclase [Thermoleophilia bacterium]|nr:diguanylate cyclase [Thermoleophilia bacterium]
MARILDRYRSISFRGRLLLLLVVVSLIQAGVAAYTFFDLHSTPAQQRVEAQLNSALRAVAPVLDQDLQASSARLAELQGDTTLQAAMEAEDWTTVESLLGNTDSTDGLVDPAAISGTDFASAADGTTADGASGLEDISGSTDGFQDAVSDSASTVPMAYVTDADGNVVAGTKPDGALVQRPGTTSTRLTRGAKLVATLNVPVVVDQEFLAGLEPYLPKGIDVFVADEQNVVSTASSSGQPEARPTGLHESNDPYEVKLAGDTQLTLTQPLLDGSILVGSSMPADVADKQMSEGLGSLWGFVFVLAAIMVLVAWFITRAVADALRKFAEVARELAGGQLSRRIPVTGDDEIADLSNSFNDMAENLEDRIERLTEARASMRRQVELFGDALANATDINEMLQAVCSLAMESTVASHSRFWVLDDEGHYDHAACIGLRPNDTEPCGLEKAVPVRNVAIRSEGEPSWLIVPARMRDGQIVGLLTLVSTEEAFPDDDLRIAERIALQAAVAIDNARMHERLRLQATRDGLTGLPNHRSLQDELTKRLAEAYETGMPLGVCLLDIDNFKRVNDTYGHPIGDEAIKAIGRTLQHGVGGMGMVGRYGGEEFVVIMPGCDADAACRIADRLREDITTIEVPLDDGGILKVTSSFGVANVDQQKAGVRVDNAELLHQADVGLYNAKRTGKNRVYLAGPDTTVIEMSEAEKAKLEARERGDVAAEQAAAAQLESGESKPYDPFDLAA